MKIAITVIESDGSCHTKVVQNSKRRKSNARTCIGIAQANIKMLWRRRRMAVRIVACELFTGQVLYDHERTHLRYAIVDVKYP